MNAAELRAELARLRGDRVVAYDCECCGTGYDWEPSPDGEYVRWEDVESLLKYVEQDER